MTPDRQPRSNASFVAQWRWWLLPALLTLALAIIFQDPFAGDWDALDYTVFAVQGHPSPLILGRMLFIYENHVLWLIAHGLFGLRPEYAYLLFKYAVIAESPLTTITWWTLARDLTGSVRAATAAALMLALSPFYIVYTGMVMTEVPSLLVLGLALLIHLRGLRSRDWRLILGGAALLGLGVNMREAALLYAPWLVLAPYACGWRLTRRDLSITLLACLSFLLFAFGPFALLWLTNAYDYQKWWYGWLESARAESGLHPPTFRNLSPLFHYFFIAAPLALIAFPFASARELFKRGFSPLFVLGALGFLANLALVMHYYLIANARYMLTGAPALLPLAASFFMDVETRRWGSERRAFICTALCILLTVVVFWFFHWPIGAAYIKERAMAKDYHARLALVPKDAVMISGGQTVAVNYWRGLGLGQWDVISTGGAWPGQRLPEVIEEYLRAGRRVFVDADPRWWTPAGWQEEETRQLVSIAPRFRFRQVSETIYEIRPPDDATANDSPHLERLLQPRRS